jgi:hypothetical protein
VQAEVDAVLAAGRSDGRGGLPDRGERIRQQIDLGIHLPDVVNRGPGGALFHRQLPPEIDADSRPQIHLFPSVNGHWQISQQENHHRRQDARYALRWM